MVAVWDSIKNGLNPSKTVFFWFGTVQVTHQAHKNHMATYLVHWNPIGQNYPFSISAPNWGRPKSSGYWGTPKLALELFLGPKK